MKKSCWSIIARPLLLAVLCALLLLLLVIAATADAFIVVLPPHQFAAPIFKAPSTGIIITRLYYGSESSTTNETAAAGASTWTLEEDWALMDAVPKFTVGDTDQTRRTFWTQLLLQTPALSQKFHLGEEDELMARYQILLSSAAEEKNADSLPRCGKSPPVLQEWSLVDDGTGTISGGRLRGSYNGRTIWIQTQAMGQFNTMDTTYPNANGDDETMSTILPGGFVESVGGRVYELGEPKEEVSTTISAVVADNNALQPPPESPVLNNISRMMTASTILSSVVLATVIRYAAAGLGGGLQQQQQPTLVQQAALPPSSRVEIIQVQRKKPDIIIEINKSAQQQQQQSISEQRARLEARVLRDARVLKTLKDRLQQDGSQLTALRTQQESASAVSDVPEQNLISEQISKIEARMGRETRVIATISERLSQERPKLQQLKQAEVAVLKQ